MRVLMTADAVGGVWTYAMDLARGLGLRGDEVTLAVLGPALTPGQAAAAKAVSGLRLIETGRPLDWTAETPEELASAALAVARLADEAGAQIVHLNSPALAAFARFPAPVVGVAHSCLRTWWSAVKVGDPPPDFDWRIAAAADGYRACNAVIAPSAAFAADTEAACGVSPIVVRNGRAAPQAPSAPARPIAVMTAGRLWDEGKDVATLDAAAAQLDAPLIAFGPVEGPQGRVASFDALHLGGNVPATDLLAAMAQARVFASAALYEPFGLAVLEAAQAGCALVLADIPTFRELWNGAADFVAPHDASGFSAAIRRLLEDEAHAARLSLAARVRSERYGLEGFVDGTAAVHRAVVGAAASAVLRAGAAA